MYTTKIFKENANLLRLPLDCQGDLVANADTGVSEEECRAACQANQDCSVYKFYKVNHQPFDCRISIIDLL